MSRPKINTDAMEGKFFVVRSKLNELVLDVQDGTAMPGQPLVMWDYNGGDNQLWYYDPVGEVIRSKLDDSYCMDLDGSHFVINYYKADKANQKWFVDDIKIKHKDHPEQVLTISDANNSSGATVGAAEDTGESHQQWLIQFRSPSYCYIKSYMHGKVLDIYKEKVEIGAKVIIWDKKEVDKKLIVTDNQLWFEGKDGIIRSKLNGYVMDSSSGDIVMAHYDPYNPNQHFVKSGNKIVLRDRPHLCLDIKGEKKKSGANVCAFEYKGSENQHWYMDYI